MMFSLFPFKVGRCTDIFSYEFQAGGSIHCHGTAKLKSDPGLCSLTQIALKGFI